MISPLKGEQKKTTFESDCLLLNTSIEANSEDPDHTAPTGAVLSVSSLLVIKVLYDISTDDITIRLFVICALKRLSLQL